MSALAVVARAWGAEVAGLGSHEDAVPRRRSTDVKCCISQEPPAPPEGWEPVVSTAFVGLVDGRSAGRVACRTGRGTAVDRGRGRPRKDDDGRDDRRIASASLASIRHSSSAGPVPQLGGNAAAGSGWLVAEGDESDRSLELLRPEIGVLTNVDLDHHSTFASRAEVEELFERWLAGCRSAVRGEDVEPVSFELAVAGEHNRRNAAAALAALELAGVDRDEAAGALAGFRGVGRRLELHGSAGGVTVVRRLRASPGGDRRDALGDQGDASRRRLLVLFQPHLYSRTRYLAVELAAALSAADAVCLTEIYAAREQPVARVTGKVVVDALAQRRPGLWIGWAPSLDDAGPDGPRRREPAMSS